jgi:penicillin-binding protein 1C
VWEGACPRWRPEGDPLRLPAGSQQALQLKLSALGDSANQGSINASFERLGRYQLSVLDEAGQTARLEFSVVD